MSLDKTLHYIYRLGSDNQHRLHWDGSHWHYEFLAGAVLFDEQLYADDQALADGLFVHGLTIDRFSVDTERHGAAYSNDIHQKQAKLTKLGIHPCAKHGFTAKNADGSCEACLNTDYPDDFKGQEG